MEYKILSKNRNKIYQKVKAKFKNTFTKKYKKLLCLNQSK